MSSQFSLLPTVCGVQILNDIRVLPQHLFLVLEVGVVFVVLQTLVDVPQPFEVDLLELALVDDRLVQQRVRARRRET